ncbi:unnamed protein product, partial [Iphiclides podalirius]
MGPRGVTGRAHSTEAPLSNVTRSDDPRPLPVRSSAQCPQISPTQKQTQTLGICTNPLTRVQRGVCPPPRRLPPADGPPPTADGPLTTADGLPTTADGLSTTADGPPLPVSGRPTHTPSAAGAAALHLLYVPLMYCGMVSPQPSFCNVSDMSASASGDDYEYTGGSGDGYQRSSKRAYHGSSTGGSASATSYHPYRR